VTTILLALTSHIVFLIAVFGIIMSIAWSGTSLTTTSALLSRWFQRRRATVLSLSTAGASAGGLLLVPVATAVLQWTGWRMTWVVLGAMVLAVAWPLACVFLRDDPTDLGLLPDGDQPSVDGRQDNPARAPGSLETETWRMALRSWPFWQLAGSYGVCGFTTAILTTHFIPYAIDRGVSPSTAATALGVMNGLDVVGVIAMGMLADRCGRKNLLSLVYAARGGAYALLLLVPDLWGLWGFAAIAGFSYWATAPLTTSLTADVYGLKALGTLSGVTFLVHQVGGGGQYPIRWADARPHGLLCAAVHPGWAPPDPGSPVGLLDPRAHVRCEGAEPLCLPQHCRHDHHPTTALALDRLPEDTALTLHASAGAA
jgi:MFS family permease